MLYHFLRFIVTIGVRLYYKEIKVINRKNLPDSGPCIYIANHPNTLMDAWLLGYVSKIPIYFMAKATLFDSALKNKILRSLNMIPINRKGEGKIKNVSNKDSFEECYRILGERKCVLIFPEGTSFLERHLRELKSGTARIALEAEKRNEGKLDIQVIPLGLNYLNANRFRSRVMVHVGRAISVKKYLADYESHSGQAAKKLTEVFRIHLEQILVNSSEKENELMIEELHQIFRSKYTKQAQKDVFTEFSLLKTIRDRIEVLKLTSPWKLDEVKEILQHLTQNLNKYEIRADFLDRRFRVMMFLRQLIMSLVLLIIGFPIYLFGVLHNGIQYKVTDVIIPKITKDIEYYAPLSVLIGLFFYPFMYALFTFGMSYFIELTFWELVLYFSLMPITGLMAFWLHSYFKHVVLKWKFLYFLLYDRQKVQSLKHEKEKLRELIFEH